MTIKEKLQKLFDKEIDYIAKNNNKYYVVLDDGLFVKPIYEVDGNIVNKVAIHPLEFNKYKTVYVKKN